MTIQVRQSLKWRLLLPMLAAATLLQMTVPLVRIVTSYRAIELEFSLFMIGAISSGFALLPVLLMVQVGRHNDRRGEAASTIAGTLIVMVAVLGLWLAPAMFGAMLGFTILLGIGQVMVISGLQMTTTRCSGPEGHDRVLGYFLMATAMGHLLGPMLLSLLTPAGALYPDQRLIWMLAGFAGLLVVSAAVVASQLPPHHVRTERKPAKIGAILKVPGLGVMLVASSVCVTTNDLIIVFLPVLAAAREIDVGTVGLLLSLRAGCTMVSRTMFSRLVKILGKGRLMTVTMLVTGLVTALIAIDMPVPMIGAALAVGGIAGGLAIACSISMTLSLAPLQSQATAMSLRMTAGRLGQFLLPFGAGTLAVVFGPGSLFVLMGACLLACGALVSRGYAAGD
jgi:MFS family permease